MPVTLTIGPNVTTSQGVIVPDVSQSNAGVMTPAMLAQLNSCNGATGNVTIYVSPSGNDKNAGTQNKPVLTLAAAMALLPVAYRGSTNRIILLNNGVTQSNILVRPTSSVSVGVLISTGFPIANVAAAPLVIQSDPIITLHTKASAPDPTGLTVIQTHPLTPGAERGNFLRCTTGANAGALRMIVSNTATQIVVNNAFTNAIAVNDKFQIEIPGASLFMSNFDNVTFGNYPTGFVSVKFQSDPNPSLNASLIFQRAIASMVGCQIDMAGGFLEIANQSNIVANFFDINLWDSDPTDPFGTFNGTDWTAGVFITNVPSGLLVIDSVMSGFFIIDNSAVLFTSGVAIRFASLNANNSQFQLLSNTEVVLSSTEGVLYTAGKSDGSTWQVLQGSRLECFGYDFSNSPADAVLFDSGSAGDLAGATGTGNVGAGIHVTGMSQCQIDVNTTVTGGAGDTLVGAVPKTYAALTPFGFSETNAGGPTMNRIAPEGV